MVSRVPLSAPSVAGRWKEPPEAHLRPAVTGWQLLKPGCAPGVLLSWGHHEPLCAKPSRGSCLETAAGRATRFFLYSCLHTEKPEFWRMKN